MALTKATYGMISADTSTIDLNIDANTLYVDSSANKVGIGTNSPDAKLRIDQDANEIALKVTGGGSGVNIAEFKRDVGATASVNIHASAGEPQIAFVDANTFSIGVNSTYFEIADAGTIGTNTRFVIDTSGNVGIGTASPSTKLDVQGSGLINGDLNLGAADSSNRTLTIAGGAAGNVEGGEIRLATAADHDGTYDFYRIDVNQDDFRIGRAGTTDITLLSSGNVGIGTNNPSAQLEINSDGSSAQGAEIRLQHANNNSTDVVSTVNFANNAGSVAMIQGGTTGANNTGYISFFTDNAGTSAEKVRILHDGNVGIGTSSPNARLESNQSITFSLSLIHI